MNTLLSLQNEPGRLEELYRFNILNSQQEKDYSNISLLASQLCDCPISFISFLDADKQWFKAKVGVKQEFVPLERSLCSHLPQNADHLEVEDLLLDKRFATHSLVTGKPNVRFYCGFALISNGHTIGSLCVLDTKPRKLTKAQKHAMRGLCRQIITLLELRLRNQEVELRIAEAEKQQHTLEELRKAQSQIISYIAHDVRNPLASLQGIIQMNDLNLLSQKETSDLMSLLNKQLDGTLNMLTNIIEWGQTQTKMKVPQFSYVDLYELAKLKCSNHEISAQLKGNQIGYKVDVGLTAWSEEYMLRFILRNLIVNANKFTSNGTITISATRQNETVLVEVSDTGVGIAPDILQKLQSAETRVTQPGTNNEKGSGIGLILVREFIENLGSSLHIDSVEGKGTRFYFSLPLHGANA